MTGRKMRVGCVVLAAGRSERFGANKLCYMLRGIPVLRRTLDALPADRLAAVIPVVSCAETEQICLDAGLTPVRYAGGPVSDSIRQGLHVLPDTDGCLFVNGDQPLLRTETVLTMLDLFEREPAAVIRASFRGQPGSPVLFPAAAFPALEALRGENGGRRVIAEGGYRVIPAEVSGEREMLDVDTPEDMARAENGPDGGSGL